MEDDMFADAVLWVIFAAAIALIACGCRYTRRPAPEVVQGRFERKIDRAA